MKDQIWDKTPIRRPTPLSGRIGVPRSKMGRPWGHPDLHPIFLRKKLSVRVGKGVERGGTNGQAARSHKVISRLQKRSDTGRFFGQPVEDRLSSIYFGNTNTQKATWWSRWNERPLAVIPLELGKAGLGTGKARLYGRGGGWLTI